LSGYQTYTLNEYFCSGRVPKGLGLVIGLGLEGCG